ncbi:MAG: tRNA lysidine(34) synthetase TilS [Spirochaetia bacterium]
MNAIENQLQNYLLEQNIRPDTKVVLGFSGGPDSTALLHLLASQGMYNILAVYINHKIRSTAEISAELKRAKSQCRKIGVEFIARSVDTEKIREYEEEFGLSTEDSARRERFRLLEEVRKSIGSTYILLAHTRDDIIENQIMRFFQGSGPRGLSGIQDHSCRVVRPLLCFEKKDLLEYLHVNNIEYSVDSTNLASDYLRNSVRNSLIPKIEKVFPHFQKSLLMLADKMQYYTEFYQKKSEPIEIWRAEENGYSISVSKYAELLHAERLEHLFYLYNRMNVKIGKERLPYSCIREAVELKDPYNHEYTIVRAWGMHLYRLGDRVFWEQDIVPQQKKGYLIRTGLDTVFTVYDSIRCQCREENQQSKDSVFLPDPEKNKYIIRCKEANDYILTKKGRKSIKKLFSEWRVPKDLRPVLPIVEDVHGVYCVCGKHAGFDNRYRYNSRKKTYGWYVTFQNE